MITFQHPYTSPTLTIELRNPDLSNSLLVENRVQVRRTMEGVLRSYIRTPVTHRLLLTLSEISKPKVQELINFLIASAGDEIKYTDYESVVWRGWLLTDPLEFTTVGTKDDTCIEVSTITLEFKGSKV